MRVAIIGAGPAGLSIARALKYFEIEYVQFERHHSLGGIWDPENPGTPMYDSAHFISSRDQSGFWDFPMPKHFPDYPSAQNILDYSRAFADRYELEENITFNTEVTSLLRKDNVWHIFTNNHQTPQLFDAVVSATGVNWFPVTPEYSGNFSGTMMHSSEYKNPEIFRDKRVLIVGLGNSGADIACDAANVAAKTLVSVRRGYYFIPKHVFGVPADVLGGSGPSMPIWLERALFAPLLKLLVGDVRKWGLPKPDHKLFESHPLINSQLLHYLQHGDVQAMPDVQSFDGNTVLFRDGSQTEVDIVLSATGYRVQLPFIQQDELLEWKGGRPDLYLNVFARNAEGFYGLGYLETNSSAYTLFDTISNVVAQAILQQESGGHPYRKFRHQVKNDSPDLSGGIKFIGSDRHANYIEINAYKKALKKLVKKQGWKPLIPGQF